MELILQGKKTIEIRTWDRKIDLPLRIGLHCSKGIDKEAAEFFGTDYDNENLGCVLGTVTLTAFKKYGSQSEFDADQTIHLNSPDQFDGKQIGLVFENVERLANPIPFKGQLGLFQGPQIISEELVEVITNKIYEALKA